jgi:hypothetical protein
MTTTADKRIDEFWIADEPVKYEIRKTAGSDMHNEGVLIVRFEGSDDNVEQALMEIHHDGDTLSLRQRDGDLDAKKAIAADQAALRGAPRAFSIWQRIWKVATA